MRIQVESLAEIETVERPQPAFRETVALFSRKIL